MSIKEEDMEVGGDEMEDDVLFADLSRQISLLIMDDHEDIPSTTACAWELISPYSFQLQGFTRNSVNQSIPPPSQSCRRDQMSKGTGVFIPKLSQPISIRRNNNYKLHGQTGRRRRSSSRSDHCNDQHICACGLPIAIPLSPRGFEGPTKFQ